MPETGPLTLSFSSAILIQLLGVITGIILARDLGPLERGELAAVVLWPSIIAALGSLGITDAIVYFAAKADMPPSVLFGTSVGLVLIISAVLMSADALIVPAVLSAHRESTITVSRWFLAYIPLNLLSLSQMAYLSGYRLFKQFFALRVGVIGASALLIVVLSVLDRLDVATAASSYIVANLGVIFIGTALCVRHSGRPPKLDVAAARELLRYGVRGHVGNAAGLLNERLDQLLISAVLPATSLGLYVVAVTMTSTTVLIGNSVALVALPLIAASSPTALVTIATRLSQSTVVLVLGLTIPLVLLTPSLIVLFFGPQFSGASAPAVVLLLAASVLALNRVLGAVLKARRLPMLSSIGELLSLGVTVVGLAVLLPALGIMGAAWTSLIAYLAACVYLLHSTTRRRDLTIRSLVLPDMPGLMADLRRLASPKAMLVSPKALQTAFSSVASAPACPVCASASEYSSVATGWGEWRKCRNCALEFANPLALSETPESLYDGAYRGLRVANAMQEFNERVRIREALISEPDLWFWTPAFNRTLDWLQKRVPRGGTVLEIGCGLGFVLHALRERGFEAVGLDVASSVVELNRRDGFKVWHGTAESVPAGWVQPDAIVAFFMLHHVVDPLGFVRCVRAKWPTAALSLSQYGPTNRDDVRSEPPRTLTRWDRGSMTRLLDEAGYAATVTAIRSSGLERAALRPLRRAARRSLVLPGAYRASRRVERRISPMVKMLGQRDYVVWATAEPTGPLP